MGIILKDLNLKVFIDKETYKVLTKTQKRRILDKNTIEDRNGYDLIIYPESRGEFRGFYSKHVNRQPDTYSKGRVFSVLVADKEFKINEKTTRLVLENALRSENIKKEGIVYTRVPRVSKKYTLSLRAWNPLLNDFEGPPKNCCFVFRGIENFVEDLDSLSGKISSSDLKLVLKYVNGYKKPQETYAIKNIWFIGKYFVAAST